MVITPFFAAPVLAGETMKNLQWQSRAVTMPIKGPITGWWLEYYFFYVRITDLLSDAIRDMFIDPTNTDLTATLGVAANDRYFYTAKGGIDYAKRCYQKVIAHYFRDEGEAWNVATYGGLPLAKANITGVFDSIMSADDYQVPGDIDADLDADGTVTAREIEEAQRQWELLRSMNLTEATYEDFIRSFGIQGRVAEDIDPHRPELIRYEKQWTYPSNTVEVSGVRTVASWTTNLRADKDRFFKEPGFIFGVTVARPKLYLGNQRGPAVHLMQDGISWLPIMLRDNDFSSLKQVTKAGSILPTAAADGFWVDIADIFVHGDQFFHNTVAATQFPPPRWAGSNRP